MRRVMAIALVLALMFAACGEVQIVEVERVRTVLVQQVGTADAPAAESSNQAVAPAGSITAGEALQHVGSRKTVCGRVESATYASGSRGQPTFINLDKPYPDQIFTVVIWGRNRSNFPDAPEQMYGNRRICATGLIESYRGVPQIEASASSDIQIASE